MGTIKSLASVWITVMAMAFFGVGPAKAQDIPPVRTVTVNDVTLTVIEDSRAPVRPAIFPGVEKDAAKLALVQGASYPCYAFVIKVEGNTVLVDTGWGTEGARKGRAVERFKEAGVDLEKVNDILITHMHTDHISGLVEEGKAVFPAAKLHISKPEYDYWVTNGQDRAAERRELAHRVAAAYEGRIELFDFGSTVLPGVLAEGTPGHTPGHTAFTITAGDSSITLIGDMVHAGSLQYRFPDISPTFDVDPGQSSATRREMLDRISARNGIMAGGHIWEVGRVRKDPDGGYSVIPVQ